VASCGWESDHRPGRKVMAAELATENDLKIKCNVFLFVEVNFSTSVFNINKSI